MAGTVTTVHQKLGRIRKIILTCTADASDGSFPDTTLPIIEGKILALRTNPGSTAPQDNYDITVEDGDAIDILQGVGANRDTSNSEGAAVVYATSVHPPVTITDTLTFKIANNNVNSAIVVATILYEL